MHPVFSVSISEPHVLFIYIRLINMSEAVCSSMSLSRSNLYRAVSFDAAFVATQFLRDPFKIKIQKTFSIYIMYLEKLNFQFN